MQHSVINPFDRMGLEQDAMARAAEKQRRINKGEEIKQTRGMFDMQVRIRSGGAGAKIADVGYLWSGEALTEWP